MKRSKEQQLIDIMFEVAIRMQMGDAKFETREECADWVTKNLKAKGFDTEPCGMSWGILK